MAGNGHAAGRFPPTIIRQAVCPHVGFAVSFRHVEDFLAERGIIVSDGTPRRRPISGAPSMAKQRFWMSWFSSSGVRPPR
jgi:transposase-like protein